MGSGKGYRRIKFREHPAVMQRKTRAAMSFFVPQEGPARERFERDFAEENLMPLPQKRALKPPVDGGEAPVVQAVKELLEVHPRVVFAVRQNSGMASYEARSGRYAPVHFYQFVRIPEPVTLPDFWGMLDDGRFFFLEAKRPIWTKPLDERERKQAAFLSHVSKHGAIGVFVRSAEEANAALA